MPIKEDRPTTLNVPQETHPDGFRFLAGLMLAALKDYDCRTTRRDTQHTPAGDYIQIISNDPNLCIYACHIKAICREAPKDQVIDALITPEGLVLSYDNTRFILKWQEPGHAAFIAQLHNGSVSEVIPPPDPWLKRACSKDKYREALLNVWSNIASDGFRVHRDPRLPNPDPLPPWNYSIIIEPARLNSNMATIKVKPFIQAIKQARVINKDILRLQFNGRLELVAKSEELGDSIIPMVSGYEHAGDDCTLAINPAFLLDALSGFDNEVYFCMDGKRPDKCPVYITDGTREAVIMPLNLS